ncbi:MAG: hypothetical protein ACRELY_06360, partial [Polyangiaceae bacterium]
LLGVGLFALVQNPACDKVKAMMGNQPAAAPDDTTMAPSPVITPEQQLMNEADQLCNAGDCQSAHDRLAVGLPPTSPLRQSDQFKALENRWATGVVAGAMDDPDVLARRKQLGDVIASTVVSADLKTRAQQDLNLLPTKELPDFKLDGGLLFGGAPDAGAGKKGGKKHH